MGERENRKSKQNQIVACFFFPFSYSRSYRDLFCPAMGSAQKSDNILSQQQLMEPFNSEDKGRHLDIGQSWVQSLTLLPTSSVTLQCHLALSLTQFYHLQNGTHR